MVDEDGRAPYGAERSRREEAGVILVRYKPNYLIN